MITLFFVSIQLCGAFNATKAVNPIPRIIPLYIIKTVPNFSGFVPASEFMNKITPIINKASPTGIENFTTALNRV